MSDNNLSKLSYTSRDYASIFQDLVNAIPSLTNTWVAREETDPGIVLVKLMSMLGDMLSYNQDKMVLELYPESVTQRKNAAQIFNLIGYKMHWYRSARSVATLTNVNVNPATVPRYTKFVTSDESLCYTNVYQLELPSNTTNSGIEYQLELVQGLPKTPTIASGSIAPEYNAAWHSVYSFNVVSSEIVSNRLYINDGNIDESTITLIDDVGAEWIQVNNVDIMTATGKFFELKVDEYDKAYLKMVNYWSDFDLKRFKLFYIVSNGESGQISSNTLVRSITPIYTITGDTNNRTFTDVSSDIRILNRASTYGYNPMTPDEARADSAKYVNTYDTLINLDDFTRATMRLNGVANCISLDSSNDPNPDLPSNTVKIYITKEPEYEDINPESYNEYINTELRSYKLIPIDIIVDTTSINYYYWTVKGDLFLTTPATIDKCNDLLVRVNNQLRFMFSQSKVGYNQTVKFLDVINKTMLTDKVINYAEIDPIEYKDSLGNIVPNNVITGKYTQEFPNHNVSVPNFNYTLQALEFPIKPGSVILKAEVGLYTIYDNGNGKLIDDNGLLRQYGSINYKTGLISFETNILLNVPLTLVYYKNVVNMVVYQNFNTQYFNVATESVKV